MERTSLSLGRGLEALISGPLGVEEQWAPREIPVSQIRPNPYQPRREFAADKLEELVQSVREHGIIQPIIVRRTGLEDYELVAGERRVRAARMAGLRTVPAIVRDYEDVQRLEVALIENIQREDINAVEAALAYRQLRDGFGFRQEEISRRVGKSPATIANTLRLLDLPDPILESLGRNEITEGHARALLQAPPTEQLGAWEQVRQRNLNVRQTEKLTRDISQGRRTIVKAAVHESTALKDPNDSAIEDSLRTALGTKVSLKRTGESGRLEIEFYSEDQLHGLLARLLGEECR